MRSRPILLLVLYGRPLLLYIFSFSFLSDNCQSCDIAKSLPPNQNRVLDGGRLHFSSLVSAATRGHAVHLPPFVHFLKSAFAYNIGRRTNPPFLKGTGVRGLWRQ